MDIYFLLAFLEAGDSKREGGRERERGERDALRVVSMVRLSQPGWREFREAQKLSCVHLGTSLREGGRRKHDASRSNESNVTSTPLFVRT